VDASLPRCVRGFSFMSPSFPCSNALAVAGRLAAFDAVMRDELWNDDDNVAFGKSVPPTIADGNVIRATASNLVVVYGLLKGFGRPVPPPSVIAKCYNLEQK
jgi:hypothetical protein